MRKVQTKILVVGGRATGTGVVRDLAMRGFKSSPVVVCDSETCSWQITHATQLLAIHPIELLAAAYDYQPEGVLAALFQ